MNSIGNDPENLGAILTLTAMGICEGDEELVNTALSEILDMPAEQRRALDPLGSVDALLSQHHISQVSCGSLIILSGDSFRSVRVYSNKRYQSQRRLSFLRSRSFVKGSILRVSCCSQDRPRLHTKLW